MVKAKNIYVSIIVVIAVSCIAMGVQRLKFYSDSKKNPEEVRSGVCFDYESGFSRFSKI